MSAAAPARPIRVAVLTSSQALLARMKDALRKPQFVTVGLKRFDRALEVLTSYEVEVVIADHTLAGGSAKSALRIIRDRAPRPTMRILIHRDTDQRHQPGHEIDDFCHALLLYPSGLDSIGPAIAGFVARMREEAPEVPSPVSVTAAAPPKPVAAIAPPPHPSRQSAGIKIVLEAKPLSDLLVPSPDLSAFIEEIERRHAALREQDLHEILGLPADASVEDVRAVFDGASMRFHPDRNRAIRDKRQRRKLNALYSAICEAYETLTSQNRSARYRAVKQSGQWKVGKTVNDRPVRLVDLSQVANAKRFLKLADAAMGAGDKKTALMNLKFAADLDPGNAQLDAKVEEWQG